MKFIPVLLSLFMLSVVFGLAGCCIRPGEKPCPPEPQTSGTAMENNTASRGEGMPQLRAPVSTYEKEYIYGTVKYVPLEGGFWGIVSDSGQKYDPVNLPKEYQEDGLKVKFRVQPLEDRASFHMWGKIVKILEITEQR